MLFDVRKKCPVASRTIASPPMTNEYGPNTKVYVRLSASLTIQFFNPTNLRPSSPECVNEVDLRSVCRGISLQGRDQIALSAGGQQLSGQNDFPSRTSAVHRRLRHLSRTIVEPSRETPAKNKPARLE